MNYGRLIVAVSAVLAVFTAGALAANVFFASPLHVAEGNISCRASPVATDTIFGILAENRGTTPLELESLTIESMRGMTEAGVWFVPADLMSRGQAPGAVDYTGDEEEQGWLPLEGAVIEPGETATIAVRLIADEPAGLATNFRVGYRGPYGIARSALSTTTFGYQSGPIEQDMECGD